MDCIFTSGISLPLARTRSRVWVPPILRGVVGIIHVQDIKFMWFFLSHLPLLYEVMNGIQTSFISNLTRDARTYNTNLERNFDLVYRHKWQVWRSLSFRSKDISSDMLMSLWRWQSQRRQEAAFCRMKVETLFQEDESSIPSEFSINWTW